MNTFLLSIDALGTLVCIYFLFSGEVKLMMQLCITTYLLIGLLTRIFLTAKNDN